MRRLLEGASDIVIGIGVLFGGFLLTAIPVVLLMTFVDDFDALLGIAFWIFSAVCVAGFLAAAVRRFLF